MSFVSCFLLLTLSLLCCACEHVKPLDRNYLAREQMSENPYPQESAVQSHIYESREGTRGGEGTGGGIDCGCG